MKGLLKGQKDSTVGQCAGSLCAEWSLEHPWTISPLFIPSGQNITIDIDLRLVPMIL
jgi:hypothetical protein